MNGKNIIFILLSSRLIAALCNESLDVRGARKNTKTVPPSEQITIWWICILNPYFPLGNYKSTTNFANFSNILSIFIFPSFVLKRWKINLQATVLHVRMYFTGR